MVTANLGDAYMQLGDFKKASAIIKSNYRNDQHGDNPGDHDESRTCFRKSKRLQKCVEHVRKIGKRIPASYEARDIEKYITRAKLNMK